ncbi:MAG: hypothetical protein P1P65_06995 [Treponema sp.]
MRIPLTRIEYEYILETFIEDHPPLYLQSGTVLHTILPDTYVLKNSRIYFNRPAEGINTRAVVFFTHKQRTISFDTRITVFRQNCCFDLPDIAYKYDPDMRKIRKIIAEIDLPERLSIKMYEHELFPLDSIIHPGLKQPLPFHELPPAYRIAYQHTGRYTTHEIPLFLYRLYDFESQISALFNPQAGNDSIILFVDHNILICGCKDRYTFSLENRHSIGFRMHFPRRYISMKGKTLFSHFFADSDTAVFGFLFEEMFEEDRRFLYENVYHEKYNPVRLINRVT